MKPSKKSRGYTLIEILVTVVIIGIFAVITIANLFPWIQKSNINNANNQIYQGISQAQAYSTQRNQYYQFSLQNNNGVLQYAVHLASVDPSVTGNVFWKSLLDKVTIVASPQTNMTSLNSIYQICFTEQGVPSTPSGSGIAHACTIPATFTPPQQITLSSSLYSNYQRCVNVSTLLGAMTTGYGPQAANSNGFTCY
jgi:prepilin-type N-terminal cleavage/methylation domain-containing protein